MGLKNTYYLFLLFLHFYAHAQLTETFSDGDFTNNPAWTGNDTSFEVLNGQLHSIDSNASSMFYLSTPSAFAYNTQWEFLGRFAFNTSSLNYADVYLISDVADLRSSSINGYFVRIGNTADEISLYVRTGAVSTKIIDGTDGILNSSNNIFKIRVTRTAANLWTLERDMTGTGNSYVTEGTITDATISSSSFFGIFIRQSTPSFFGKHYFDDISVAPIQPDTTPPFISSLSVISQNQVDVYFNEAVEQNSAQTISNYTVNNGIGTPVSAMRDSGNFNLVHLTFSANFVSTNSYTLTITGVQDNSANTIISASGTFFYFVPQRNDVQINEIMADINPVPNIIPPYEYIELYNRSAFPVNLNGWKLSDASSTVTLPAVTILPDSFYIITSITGALAFSSYGPVTGISSFPSLNDAGDDLVLRDAGGNVISVVFYRDHWYGDVIKDDGGWSLEQIDPNNPCGGKNNWKASSDSKGGTPGKTNSVNTSNPDLVLPKLVRASVPAADTVVIFFDEPMDVLGLGSLSSYTIDNGIGNPVYASSVAPEYMGVKLGLPSPLLPGIIYTLTASSLLKDCSGNSLGKNTVRFGLTQPAAPHDLAINEILFDPKEGGVEWVEIYNRSSKIIDLKEIFLCSRDKYGNFSDINQISSEGFLIFPEDYIVLSTNQSAIKSEYNTTNTEGFVDMYSIPSLNNDSDVVVLINTSQQVIEEVKYHSDWHLPLLSDSKGFSLERINYDFPAQDKNNWHTAAESAGGATPAYKNSQYTDGKTGNEITVSPEIFSPDNDGYNDVLAISYSFDTPGMVGNVHIYDSRGRLIKNLIRNELLAISGTFYWDGITNDKTKARLGIYIVWFEAFDDKGNVKRYKTPCVVGGKL